MKTHYMKLERLPFNKIKAGIKTIEIRLNDTKRRQVTIGDQIEFVCLSDTTQKIRVRVIALHRYSTFKELYMNLPHTAIGYGKDEKADSNDMLKYYSESDQTKWGVVGIEIEKID